MRRFLVALAALTLPFVPLAAQRAPAPVAAAAQLAQPAPLSELVRRVDIPFERFTLPNGLRVIVHTDRKAPLVSVGVWYHVGSRDEPLGRGGFAHLFEHLMFYGSQHHNDEHFKPLEAVGATDSNGTTSFDRTNYFQTVPTPALDLALFLESDRMGWLLPAVTQDKLNKQRDVVKNEKRQGDNQPYGQVGYVLYSALFPADHPYSVTPIGNPRDLDAATMDDVRQWFQSRYGPNNAVLVLAGDIDAKTARPLVEKYFGNIQPGPTPARLAAPVPERKATQRITLTDKVATARLYRAWAAPGKGDAAVVPLDVALTVLAGGPTSRLFDALVRREGLAVGVSGGVSDLEKASVASLVVDVRPGVDPAKVEARVDQLLAEFMKDGPTADEVSRVATRAVSGTIRGLERVGGFGGKGVALAEGELYEGDPAAYKRDLQRYAEATPAGVLAAARRWMTDGDVRLSVLPGERKQAEIVVPQKPRRVETPAKPAVPAPLSAGVDRSRGLPPVGEVTRLDLPAVERAKLSNGMAVQLARNTAVPVVRLSITQAGGIGADSRDKPGLQGMMLALLDEGTNGRLGALSGPDIARLSERLGVSFGASATLDRSRFAMNALVPNLRPSLQLFADVVREPTFPPAELERVRAQALAGLAAERTEPNALAVRTIPPLLYGMEHPYGRSFTGSGTEAGVKAVTRDDLLAFHRAALRPEAMTIIAVGDTTMAELLPLLEQAFGDWRAATPAPVTAAVEPQVAGAKPGVLLIDRPGAPQSLILAGRALSATGRDDRLDLGLANDILGGMITSRLNNDLRERRGWAYGASSSISPTRFDMPFLLSAPVQTDRTGASIAAARDLLRAFATTAPPTADELEKARQNSIRSLPGEFETGGALLSSMERALNLGRPDDYLETLPARLNAVTLEQVRKAGLPGADELTWIVVGDSQQVEPQLKALGLPVRIDQAEAP